MLGAEYTGNYGCRFRVWAPQARRVQVRFPEQGNRLETLSFNKGYWQAQLERIPPGTRYVYRLDDQTERPDPASHHQPDGVHGPSAVVDHAAYTWCDAGWEGVPLEDMILYELHVGTFTPEGTFAAIIPRLAALRELGVTAIELMPVAQFPGQRNWGYDGVYPYAVQQSYGGPENLKRLVDAIHREGMSAVLDVVYNHLGPEGNYLRDFGPYFTDYYQTPWGQAINYDQAHSHDVREFFIQNALYWLRDYHFDALRLDAVHAIYDGSAKHILAEMDERVSRLSCDIGRTCYLIAESALNDVRVIKPRRSGGYGMDAQWSDDFHHSLHALLTGERNGYYQDYGQMRHLIKAFKEGFVYSWQYSPYRRRFFGSSSKSRPARQFVICTQNHDQVGNRMLGERLGRLVDFETLKLAAGALLLSPYIPMLFMGEEYADDAPFQYFVDHSDPDLIEAVRAGRRREFESFHWDEACPDPQAADTFENSKLKWHLRNEGTHQVLLRFYQHVLALRKRIPKRVSKKNMVVRSLAARGIVVLERQYDRDQWQCLMNFSDQVEDIELFASEESWIKILDSTETHWGGPGAVLPNEVQGNTTVSIPRRSLAVFQNKPGGVLHEQAEALAAESIVL